MNGLMNKTKAHIFLKAKIIWQEIKKVYIIRIVRGMKNKIKIDEFVKE